MTEHPIIFSGEMVRAILAGRKTQTRRVIKDIPNDCESIAETETPGVFPVDCRTSECWDILCQYGNPGHHLWVRERLNVIDADQPDEGGLGQCIQYAADAQVRGWTHDEDGLPTLYPFRRKSVPSIHMPRWASRITLELTDVRVERVQDITEEDARAEGMDPWSMTREEIADIQISDGSPDMKELARLLGPGSFSHKFTFQMLWDELNKKRRFGWNVNPWVWALSFKRVEQEA